MFRNFLHRSPPHDRPRSFSPGHIGRYMTSFVDIGRALPTFDVLDVLCQALPCFVELQRDLHDIERASLCRTSLDELQRASTSFEVSGCGRRPLHNVTQSRVRVSYIPRSSLPAVNLRCPLKYRIYPHIDPGSVHRHKDFGWRIHRWGGAYRQWRGHTQGQ